MATHLMSLAALTWMMRLTVAGATACKTLTYALSSCLSSVHIAHSGGQVQRRGPVGTGNAVWTVMDTGSSQVGIITQQHRQGLLCIGLDSKVQWRQAGLGLHIDAPVAAATWVCQHQLVEY